MCGKVIRSDDDGVLAKFTEQARGQIEKLNKKAKFGRMYIDFNSQCLETFDRENNYGPGKCFD